MTRPLSTTLSGSGFPDADQASETASAGVPVGMPAAALVVLSVAAASEPRHSRAATTTSATVAAVHTQTRTGGWAGRGPATIIGGQAADSEPLPVAPPRRRPGRRGLHAPASAV